MFATLIKVFVALGSLAIAGISAYVTYKRNSGSHTFTNSTNDRGYYGRPAYAYNGGYGYGYNPYRRPSKRISRTGNIDQDLVTHTDSINELYEEVDNIHASVDEILAELKRRGYNYRMKQPKVATVQTPVGPQQVIVDDIMDTNQEKEIARREEAFTDRIVAIFNREYNAYRDSIMRRASAPIPTPVPAPAPTPIPTPVPAPIIPTQDPNVSVIPAPVQQPMNQTQYPTHNFSNLCSDTGVGAIDTSYMFNMNRGFEQFYDSDLYRRLCQDRRNGLPTMNPDFQTTQIPTIPTPSPVMNNYGYQQPGINLGTQVLPTLDNMQQIQTPIASYGMPDTSMPTFEKPIDGSDQMFNPTSMYAGVMPSTRKVYSYGHYGEPMPSTRKVYSYSNCY